MNELIIFQIILVIIFLIVIFYLIRQRISLTYTKRISKYGIDPLVDKSKSLIDKFIITYHKIIIKFRNILEKNKLLNNISQKYNKYINYNEDTIPIDFIINKLLFSLLFLFVMTFAALIQLQIISLLEVIVSLFIGYFIPDIYYKFIYLSKKKKIKEDMLKAIIIMNNAFKAGKSTLQALELAKNELPYPTKIEFEHIYKDLSYGLSLDVVFERFTKRVDIEEARYISSSLTILQKTGGNIVKVFNSIERSLYDKQKLRDELKNLTVNSNFVIKVLTIVPILFILGIYMLNPSYFNPLFTSITGYIIIGIIIIMFSFYIFLLKKITKVKV